MINFLKILKNLTQYEILFYLASTQMILLITAYFLRFGFDLTDESYYFNWIVGWENYGGSPSMFGPFLGWFLGDVTLHSMRLIGFVTLTTSAILVGYSLRGSGSDSRATYSIVFICALGGVN